MKLRALVVAVAMALASGTAFAYGCPKDMKAIDEALAKNPKLTDAQMAEVKKLRVEGEKFHNEKPPKHTESLEALGKAKKILGI